MNVEQVATAETAAPVVTEAASDDAILSATFDRLVTNNGSDRDEGGKFASPASGEKTADTIADAGAEGAEPAEQAPPTATLAPAHLPNSLKAQWEKMPEEARAEVAKLTSEWDRKFGEQGKLWQAAKPVMDRLNEAIQKHPEFRGMSPDDIGKSAAQLAAVQVSFNKNPVGTIMDLARSANVLPQLAQIFSQGEQKPGDQGQIIASLERKIAQLEAEHKRASNPDAIRETVSTTLAEKEAKTTLENWAKAQTFYAEVEADLPHYVAKVIEKSGRERPHTDILTDAYDMAINANPEVRAKVRAAEVKTTAANQDPKRAEAAKKAASINVPSGSGKEREPTEDEILSATYDRMRKAS